MCSIPLIVGHLLGCYILSVLKRFLRQEAGNEGLFPSINVMRCGRSGISRKRRLLPGATSSVRYALAAAILVA